MKTAQELIWELEEVKQTIEQGMLEPWFGDAVSYDECVFACPTVKDMWLNVIDFINWYLPQLRQDTHLNLTLVIWNNKVQEICMAVYEAEQNHIFYTHEFEAVFGKDIFNEREQV